MLGLPKYTPGRSQPLGLPGPGPPGRSREYQPAQYCNFSTTRPEEFCASGSAKGQPKARPGRRKARPGRSKARLGRPKASPRPGRLKARPGQRPGRPAARPGPRPCQHKASQAARARPDRIFLPPSGTFPYQKTLPPSLIHMYTHIIQLHHGY